MDTLMTHTFVPTYVEPAQRICVTVTAGEMRRMAFRAKEVLLEILIGIENEEIGHETARRQRFNQYWLIRKLPFLRRSTNEARVRKACPSLNDAQFKEKRIRYLHLRGILNETCKLLDTAQTGHVSQLQVPLKTWEYIETFASRY